MTSFLGLVRVEIARDLSRRLVRVLVLLALFGCAFAGVVAWINTSDAVSPDDPSFSAALDACTTDLQLSGAPASEAERHCRAEVSDAITMDDLWNEEGEDVLLGVPLTMLLFGGLLAGASVIGAEWRAGTVTTVLTWEPRRVRLATARFVAEGFAATVIALLVTAAFIAAMLPAILVHGSTEGVDADWWTGMLALVLRGAVLTGVAAVAGGAIAMLARNTVATLVVAFAYMMILENALIGWKPWVERWMLTRNAAVFLIGETPSDVPFERSASLATATLAVYATILVGAALLTFRHRDIAATT